MSPERIERQLGLWPATAGGAATLINLSENHTFRVDAPDGGRYALRVHRPGYNSGAAIGSELRWLEAISRDTDVPCPRPLPGSDGALVQRIADGDGASRHAVLFGFLPGRAPGEDEDLAPGFRTLGRLAATLHRHVEGWRRPAGFTRLVWDAGAVLDPGGLWGDWRAAPGVDAAVRPVLDRLDARLRADLGAYGRAPDRFGLIHADMRLANLLVDGGTTRLIDFDDCGFGWFAYDFAAAVSFFEDAPAVPELKAAWLDGYRAVRPFGTVDEGAMEACVLLRRMALLAWIGSHGEVPEARARAGDFAAGTAALAERYLRG